MRSITNLNPFNSFEISLIVTSVVWAVLILFILGESEAPIISGDGVIYNQMALNLINYQTISFFTTMHTVMRLGITDSSKVRLKFD